MARRRTKKDKIISQLRRQIKSGPSTVKENKVKLDIRKDKQLLVTPRDFSEKKDDYNSLFSYDSSLLSRDIVKSLMISAFAFAAIFLLRFVIN